ncbi:hypothetical protein MJM04_30560, partial [Salmonella enterica subsp. enterica serovar Cerro]|nr:hypothetical protein [Salmonella enterica subsp. enterica serovar Cerro]
SQVAARLDILKPAPFVFTVAGTNGKGTTCRTLESVLIAAGYRGQAAPRERDGRRLPLNIAIMMNGSSGQATNSSVIIGCDTVVCA